MIIQLQNHYNNRILDLEHELRQINTERYRLVADTMYRVSDERMLAFRYYIKHKELVKARKYLDYPEPRRVPAWVRRFTDDSIVRYIAFGE